MKKPKIAFIHPAIGESFGGSQIFVLELAQRLKDRCDITILSAKKENDLCKPVFSFSRGKLAKNNQILYSLIKKISSRFISTPDIVSEHLSSFFPVLLNLLQNNYDVIFPNNDWGGLLVASAARKIKGTPILFTEHCGFMEKGKIAERNLKFKPDKYIVLSEELKFWVKKYYPDSCVEYIPNGVDLDRFNPNVHPKFIDLPRPIFMAAARYQDNKRLDLTIEAVAKLNEGSLLILSSGKNIENLNQKGKTLLGEDRFKLISAPYYEMPHYYRACDVFTLPSVYEPFGLVYLEAMACNKPIVAPNDDSRAAIINKAGILCDVRDIDTYASTLKLTAQSTFNNIPYNQAQKYDWEITADKYYRVIKSLILG
ncbi:MAG: glycosyltransferase [bacterium]